MDCLIYQYSVIDMRNLIPYFTLGYPDNETLKRFLMAMPINMINYIEFGFPSNDPRYDGPTIRKTHRIGNENYDESFYIDIFNYFNDHNIKMYSLSYYSDIKDIERFAAVLSNLGFSGSIIPDLLIDYYDEAFDVINKLNEMHFEYIPFFTPSTPDNVIKKVSEKTYSWIYYGLQPSTGIDIPYDLDYTCNRIFSLVKSREINFGFGIKTIEDVSGLIRRGASGVAIGSYLVNMLDGNDLNGFLDYLKRIRGALDVES